MSNAPSLLLSLLCGLFAISNCHADDISNPHLIKKLDIPEAFLAEGPKQIIYGGDIRIGDLSNDGQVDFLVYRSQDDVQNDGSGMKPCFLGAFDKQGRILWQQGEGGVQPTRPGPIAIHDIDGDGETEILCFWHDPNITGPPNSMRDAVIQIRDGSTGIVEKEATPAALLIAEGEGPNWVHQRLFICNLRGTDTPRDFIVKLGTRVLAFNQELEVLWSYSNPWNEYTKCPAYIPSVGDIDGDGKDEINGGYFLLDDDGSVLWEVQLGRNMDSVTIAPWDNGKMRAFGSGFGHVLDEHGNVLLKLGEEHVPHGQELRVADFDPSSPGPEMAIRYDGHNTPVMIVDVDGKILRRFELNHSPNNTGMEAVYWNGADQTALLYNGGSLWAGDGTLIGALPGLPTPQGQKRRGWYHCIPADLTGDEGEEVVIYNPWDSFVAIYGKSAELDWKTYLPTVRQYNVRLMD